MIETGSEAGFRSVGQRVACRTALVAAERDELGRTLLVHGPAGAGKGAFVDDLLALIFCTQRASGGEPCNACRGCLNGRSRTHPDLVTGSPERWREARSTGESIVAAARRWLLEAAGAPVVAPRRVVLIERADRANEQTQNALLKALEEPTDRHTFILVADEPRRLLPTIRSRCRPLRIGPVGRAELAAHLSEELRLPADQADALAQLSGGLVGRARGFVERADRLDWRRRTQLELMTLLGRGRADRLSAVRDLLDEASRAVGPASGTQDGEEAESARAPAFAQREAALLMVEAWSDLTRDLVVAAAGRLDLAPSRELGPDLERWAARSDAATMAGMATVLDRTRAALEENCAPRLALEAAMLAWPNFAGTG